MKYQYRLLNFIHTIDNRQCCYSIYTQKLELLSLVGSTAFIWHQTEQNLILINTCLNNILISNGFLVLSLNLDVGKGLKDVSFCEFSVIENLMVLQQQTLLASSVSSCLVVPNIFGFSECQLQQQQGEIQKGFDTLLHTFDYCFSTLVAITNAY